MGNAFFGTPGTTQIEIIEDETESEIGTEKEEDIETITEAKNELFADETDNEVVTTTKEDFETTGCPKKSVTQN